MIDPLSNFEWSSLHGRYDRLCRRFGSRVTFPDSFVPRPTSDRELYYFLVERLAVGRTHFEIGVEWYEAMLYWKLYSQPAAVANVYKPICENESLRCVTGRKLSELSRRLPADLPRDQGALLQLIKSFTREAVHGMASFDAFPVRTTFLHFVYPEVVPIFDKQVLRAVGVFEKNANHSAQYLLEYVVFAWELANKYSHHFGLFGRETATRLIDMALWVSRGSGGANS